MLGLLILAFVGPGIGGPGPSRPFVPEPYAGADIVRFAVGTEIDTRTTPGIDPDEQSPAPLLVSLSGPVRREWLARIDALGFEPLGYLAYQTIICRPRAGAAAASLLALDFVGWAGAFPIEAKLAPEFTRTSGTVKATLALWPGAETDRIALDVARAGGVVLKAGNGTITFRADARACRTIADNAAVAFIQPRSPVVPFNDDAQWVIQSGWQPEPPLPAAGRPVWERGLRGQGMIVGLFDSGINTDHDMFADPLEPLTGPGVFPHHRKIAAYKLYPGAWFGDHSALSYHGSSVAGTLAGDDSVMGDSVKLEGMAPDARIYFLDVASNGYQLDDNYTEMLDSVRLGRGMDGPVRQVSGSFGSTAELGYYRIEEASLDAVCWNDPGFLVIWAAGNSGTGPRNVGHPACAKSALTIGASGNGVAANLVASFSSRGPAADGRTKPDLVAPGLAVMTVGGWTTHDYRFRNGTSYAAPAVSGALTLLRQYLNEGWFPAGAPDSARSVPDPSSALMRAFAVTSTDSNVGSRLVPNIDVGWGRLNLSNILHFAGDTLTLTFADEPNGLSTGMFHEYEIDVTRRAPLRVVLAWTDTAAAAGAAIALVNDLNLELLSPDGNRYRGNQFLEGQSRANPAAWDELNTIEVCQLDHPVTGRWRVRVLGRNVYTWTQPYGLVIKAGLPLVPGIADRPADPAPMPVTGSRIITGRAALAGFIAGLPPGSRAEILSVDGRLCARLPGPTPELRPGIYQCRITGPTPAVVRLTVVLSN